MKDFGPLNDPGNVTIETLTASWLNNKNIELDILRLDKIHPVISGNKWFKLKYFMEGAIAKEHSTVLTFGGAWSNHIIATACASKLYGLQSIGVIRGERPRELSQTLQDAIANGMTLEFTSRKSYAEKYGAGFTTLLSEKYGSPYFIPEGGAGPAGIKGSKEILEYSDKKNYSHITCCIGTGTMFCGLLEAALPSQEVVGISVLKGNYFTPEHLVSYAKQNHRWKIFYDYHHGGYAKRTTELISFMNDLYRETKIPTDFVYTGKLLFAVADLVLTNYFPPNSKVLVIHSGGLQGNASLPAGTLNF